MFSKTMQFPMCCTKNDANLIWQHKLFDNWVVDPDRSPITMWWIVISEISRDIYKVQWYIIMHILLFTVYTPNFGYINIHTILYISYPYINIWMRKSRCSTMPHPNPPKTSQITIISVSSVKMMGEKIPAFLNIFLDLSGRFCLQNSGPGDRFHSLELAKAGSVIPDMWLISGGIIKPGIWNMII